MPELFRSMKESPDGGPEIGPSARTLGVRPGIDVPLLAGTEGLVGPGEGGWSVAPDNPLNLPRHRRPPEFQGDGKDSVWCIDSTELGPDLAYRQDPKRSSHGFVEPARAVSFDEYQQALARTCERWPKIDS